MGVAAGRSPGSRAACRGGFACLAGCAVLLGLLLSGSGLAAQEGGVLRVGAIRYKTESDFLATYEPLVAHLAAEVGLRPQLILVSEAHLAYQLAAGEFDLGIFTPFPYLKAKLDFPQLEVFASHVVQGGETYRGAILVRADSAIRTLDDLKGKSMLFVKPTSTSGFKLPEGILRENGLHLDETPNGHEFSGEHAVSVRRLLAGEFAGIAVDLDVLGEFSAAERAGLRVLEEYHVPYHAYVLSPQLAVEAGRRLRDEMLRAHLNPANASLFANPIGIERWVARDDTFYNGLRRYLGMVRSKPQVTVSLQLKESARRALERHGDLIEALDDAIRIELRRSRRFELKPPGSASAAREVAVDLALVGEIFHCQLSLDGEWLRSVDFTQSDLLPELPGQVTRDVLAAIPVESPLLFNGAEWFITYGLNDGIEPASYDFAFRNAAGDVVRLSPEAVETTTPLNTRFSANEQFRRGTPILVTYRAAPLGSVAAGERAAVTTAETDAISHMHAEASQLRRFWSNLDNRWGVISLVIATLSLAVGGYLRMRKQRRFRTVLNESLDLLRVYLEGKYDLQVRLAQQREKILQYLEKNFINENQYLILKHHLDEVESVITQLASEDVGDTQEVQAELQQIVRDGKVTAEELEHLAATLRQAGGEEESVS